MPWRRADIRGEEPELFVGLGDAVIICPAFQEHGYVSACIVNLFLDHLIVG
jgi:hypothetical protein